MVETELEKLVLEGTLEPVEHSDWATQLLQFLNQTNEGCAFGDFKQPVNPVAKLDKYPIPRVEDLFVKLAGGKAFTKLDLSQAYLQLPLDEESKELVVVNNSKTLLTKDTYWCISTPTYLYSSCVMPHPMG